MFRRQQLTQVMTEFYGLLETQQYMVRGGPAYAMKLLTEAFGTGKAEQLLAQVNKVRERSTGDLAMLQKMEPAAAERSFWRTSIRRRWRWCWRIWIRGRGRRC